MKILIIGGTRFVGKHIVTAARARGHEVTLFHRGKTNAVPDANHGVAKPDGPGAGAGSAAVEHIHGDRTLDLSPLAGRRWDAVVDTCGYVPRITRMSAEFLRGAVDHYVFISSVSVYAEGNPPGQDEHAPVATLADETTEEITGETYGGLKVLCERSVHDAWGDRALTIRPGLIVGPDDYTDRFPYWVDRIARGGEVLAPGDPAQPLQVIDARDLGEWTVRLVEARQGGVLNAVGPDHVLSMERFLETCRAEVGPRSTLTWVAENFLLERGVAPWTEVPLWVPAKEASFSMTSNRRAIEAGLTFRSIAATIRDTLAWSSTRPADHEWRAGMKPEREAALLREWHAANG